MLTLLAPDDCHQPFPDVSFALREPEGLLAVGGCLSIQRLKNAYRQGIFPWYDWTQPILWWSPDPRLILIPEKLKLSKSLKKTLKKESFRFSFDTCFEEVIQACAEPRAYTSDTWLVEEMKQAYIELHNQGLAHSFEAWQEDRLVGGLYGVAIGQVFFGESMFHRTRDASKAAFAFAIERLKHWGYQLVDCQVHSEHLISLGAEMMPRTRFIELLQTFRDRPTADFAWQKQQNRFTTPETLPYRNC